MNNLLQEIVSSVCQVTDADCAIVYPYDPVRRQFYELDSIAACGLDRKSVV